MRSVGIRKRSWFRTAGVVTVAAQLLGVGGLAYAADKACFPKPTFVYGGDPAYDKLDANDVTRWTGSSGYGWNSGSATEMSYQGAIGSNPDYVSGTGVPGHPEILDKRMLLSFQRNIPISQVDKDEGVRVGLSYDFTDSLTMKTKRVSQIIVVHFDTGDFTSTFSNQPPDCPPPMGTSNCANNPSADPNTFVSYKPPKVDLLQEVDDLTTTPPTYGTVANWPTSGSGDPTQWVKDHTVIWFFADKSVTPTKYFWRLHMALPLSGGAAPDPGTAWTSPSVWVGDVVGAGGTKNMPPFWVDMITLATDLSQLNYKHFPDWADDHAVGRVAPYDIPRPTFWGQAEVGSPRDPSLLTPGDIHCDGTGILIPGTVGDNVVWHSTIWNTKAGTNTAGVFNDGGKLYMLDATSTPGTIGRAHNKMAVQVLNTSSTPYDRANIKAQFFVAPYGSQAAQSIWTPMNIDGNNFSCDGGASINNPTCTIVPASALPIDSVAVGTGAIPQSTTMSPVPVEFDQKDDWIPATNYVCAVQKTDTMPFDWNYHNLDGVGELCHDPVYKPMDANPGPTSKGGGLPGHQCIQAQLSGTGVQFATKSAFRNMHQNTASLTREVATIDTKGLKKVKGQKYHDIYLYVETQNMPYRVDTGYSPRTYNTAMQIYNRYNNCGVDNPSILSYAGNYIDGEGECPGGFDPNIPAPSDEYFTKTMPTFTVHAYADTGDKFTRNGRTVPVLTQLTSFGQYFTHDSTAEGPVFGWDASLEPVNGTTFQKVGPNTYRIRVPNDGAGQVVTHVEALPTKRPTCAGTVDMNIVQLLKAIAPLIDISPEDAGEINALIDSLQIECVDLQWFLNKIGAHDWGCWSSWIKFLIDQINAASGCKCN
jgi:hypothetical protein